MQVRAWLSEGGLGVYALMFHALGLSSGGLIWRCPCLELHALK
jgi:hypothetical protein